MATSNPAPVPRSVLVVLTLDGGDILATPAAGSPRLLREATALAQLRDIAADPTVPEHRVEASGLDIGAVFRGIARTFADAGKGEQ